jgi:Phosphate-selective porin O and P
VSEDQTFLIRRARLILSGDLSDHMSVYLQPDFASIPNGSVDAIQFAQIRDWYADCFVDKDKIHRFRLGQSKIPFGWENMQSSSNRLPLDRSDSLNSAARNERDLGVFYYWTPTPAQAFFKDVVDKGLKGSGNYGVFAFGFYDGQGGSLAEQNDNLHMISRLTVPMELCSGQFAEVGMQGYTGRYSVLGSTIRPLGVGAPILPVGTIDRGNRRGIVDERLAWTAVWYPQPLGFQSEWTVGRGPALNGAQTVVEERALYGGYVMTMYKYDTCCHGIFIPYARWNLYRGGYKPERNAPYSKIDEWEIGCEWQLNKQMEFVAMYTVTDRTNTTAINQLGTASYQQFDGNLLRFQFQVNY